MAKPGDAKNIPNFLSAGSPKRLRRFMLANNARAGKEFQYFDISFNTKDGKWYAWFYEPIVFTSKEFVK